MTPETRSKVNLDGRIRQMLTQKIQVSTHAGALGAGRVTTGGYQEL